jgi:DNA polymerase-3 subunit gamma/tau
LLKTLEEPPPHVVFLFATTEIHKVPLTIVSRCQQFRLRRLNTDTLAVHLQHVLSQTALSATPEALRLIAELSEGSVRDALSLLDQAIAAAEEATITADMVQAMVGMATRGHIVVLLTHMVHAALPESITTYRDMIASGAAPLAVLHGLCEAIHAVVCAHTMPQSALPLACTHEDDARIRALAQASDLARLFYMWHYAQRGIGQLRDALDEAAGVEMVLLAMQHVYALPAPDASIAAAPTSRMPTATATPHPLPATAEACIALFATQEPVLHALLQRSVRVVTYAPPHMTIALDPEAPPSLVARMAACLDAWTGCTWRIHMVPPEQATHVRSLAEEAAQDAQRTQEAVAAAPELQGVFAAFPGAAIQGVDPAPPVNTPC